MAQPGANPVITELTEPIARLEGVLVRRNQLLAFDVREIHEHLPGGGLSFGAVHEFAGGGSGTVDGAAAALFAAGIAARTKGRTSSFRLWLRLAFSRTASSSSGPTRRKTCLLPWRRPYRSAVSERSSPNLSDCR